MVIASQCPIKCTHGMSARVMMVMDGSVDCVDRITEGCAVVVGRSAQCAVRLGWDGVNERATVRSHALHSYSHSTIQS